MLKDRESAGEALADRLTAHRGAKDTLVLGLPRGGVVVASVIRRRLGIPIDVFLSQKLRAPSDREFAYGAVTECGNLFIDPASFREARVTEREQERELEFQRQEIAWRKRMYRGMRPLPSLAGRNVIVVDDGIATGATMTAAIEGVRAQGAKTIFVAAPVGALPTLLRLTCMADGLEALEVPDEFRSIGSLYENFPPVSNAEVIHHLSAGHPPRRAPTAA